MDQDYHIVEYKVFEGDMLIHQGNIPLHLVVGGRGGDSSLSGMWNPEWHWNDLEYHGLNRRVEVYLKTGKTFILGDNASFNPTD
jgi:hypothetical protein